MIFVGLFTILALVLFVPFLVKKVEKELEIFLFSMGCIALTITSQWSLPLVEEALIEPVTITLAVFIAGIAFRIFQPQLVRNVNTIAQTLGVKVFSFLIIVLLGLFSSVITAIIAALVLVEIISALKLERQDEIRLVVLACFSIGMGAALTPIGEPLSTIAIAKLKGEPYCAGFFFLWQQLWAYIIPGVIGFGILGIFMMPSKLEKKTSLQEDRKEDVKTITVRSLKVYLFVMALVFLGKGFKPVIDAFIIKIPSQGLYWINIISAVLDNATLAAAEIGSSMGITQIKSALLGLLLAGGMLIPGNIPNIIAAGKLNIKSSEWAKVGVPLGLIVMAAYFLLLFFARA